LVPGDFSKKKKKVAHAGHNLHFHAQPIYLAFSERFMSLCARAVFEKFRSDFITSEYYLATRGTSSRRQSKLVQLRQRAPAFWCKIPATQSRARFCPQSSFSLATAAAVCASMPPAPTPDTKPAERMRSIVKKKLCQSNAQIYPSVQFFGAGGRIFVVAALVQRIRRQIRLVVQQSPNAHLEKCFAAEGDFSQLNIAK
jgi:hypothetical protein